MARGRQCAVSESVAGGPEVRVWTPPFTLRSRSRVCDGTVTAGSQTAAGNGTGGRGRGAPGDRARFEHDRVRPAVPSVPGTPHPLARRASVCAPSRRVRPPRHRYHATDRDRARAHRPKRGGRGRGRVTGTNAREGGGREEGKKKIEKKKTKTKTKTKTKKRAHGRVLLDPNAEAKRRNGSTAHRGTLSSRWTIACFSENGMPLVRFVAAMGEEMGTVWTERCKVSARQVSRYRKSYKGRTEDDITDRTAKDMTDRGSRHMSGLEKSWDFFSFWKLGLGL
ncbi:hypothetical protein BJY52DRAFT_392087 [Lactarius psammicola]|nr:hypothetical protein BJY52DRAFT_392087 [Lactarius psammicola]